MSSAAEGILHLNGVKELENSLGFLHLKPPGLIIDKKRKSGLNEGPVFVKNGTSISGFTTVAKALVTHSNHPELLGKDSFERAEVDQWLDYTQSFLCYADSMQLKALYKDLNAYLEDKTYFVSDSLTIADIIMFAYLYKGYKDLIYSDRENLINLSRWYDHVQHIPHVRQKLPELLFHRTTLY